MKITIRQLVEIVGVFAVVLSLLFVGYELQLARSIAESEAFIQVAEVNQNLDEFISSNADIWAKGCLAEELTPSEEIIFTSVASSVLGYQFTRWRRSIIGISSAPELNGPILIARNRYNFPGINAAWERRPTGSDEFRGIVDEQIELLLESNVEQISEVSMCGR